MCLQITHFDLFLAVFKLTIYFKLIILLLFFIRQTCNSILTPSGCDFASYRTCGFYSLPSFNTVAAEQNSAFTTCFWVIYHEKTNAADEVFRWIGLETVIIVTLSFFFFEFLEFHLRDLFKV